VVAPEATPAPANLDFNRRGTFIVTDVYPKDLDDPHTPQIEIPPFKNLVGLTMNDGHEVIGAIIKASQGTGWGAANENWFKESWRRIKEAGGERYGKDWFRGAYHFLTFQKDGTQQADYFLRLVEQAGGWDVGDIMPMVDAEEGGQGTWAGGEKLEKIADPAKRRRLAQQVIDCVGAFAERVRSRTGNRVMLYGRGIMRDLQINNRMKCDAVANPAYTEHMPPMDKYGWPIKDVVLWQLCGDGDVHCPGFSSEIPGWGKEDYSVYIDGANKTDLASFRKRVLAKSR
jgi:GH25 family lysozyme M1 (1,4-beta-N-acetylmuramidase)